MSLTNWISNTTRRVRSEGFSALGESIHMLYNGSWRIFGSRLPLGTHVYERDWELLVLLDGCRVDTLQSFEGETVGDFVEDVGRLQSVASTSREWLAKTFTPKHREEVAQTAYITANPYTTDILSKGRENRSPFNPANWPSLTVDDFLVIDESWQDGWDNSLGTVPPAVLTDRAIAASREYNPDRLIVHYMQPHQPFIGERARANGNAWIDGNCWDALRRGEANIEDVRDAYRENLAVVLENVELLLKNIDANPAVISADHGNAFGEWGIYGHPNGFLHASVKEVPWLEAQATDERTYEPNIESVSQENVNQTIEGRLSNLGYL